MKSILKSLSLLILAALSFSCIDEVGEVKYQGQIELQLLAPAPLQASGYRVRAKLYRAYTDETIVVELNAAAIDGQTLTTVPYTISHGNWTVVQANILAGNVPVFVAVKADDDRAGGADASLLLPKADNVIDGQLTTFALQVFDVKTADDEVLPEEEDEELLPESDEVYATYDFEDGTDRAEINQKGWSVVHALGGGDKFWEYRSFGGNRYAQASAHNGTAATYASEIYSPVFNLNIIDHKNFDFETSAAYFVASSSLKVYVEDVATKVRTEVFPRIAAASDKVDGSTYTPFISSGSVSLAAFYGKVQLVFQYNAEGGASNSTTYQLDNFRLGVANPQSGDDNGDDGGEAEMEGTTYIEDFSKAEITPGSSYTSGSFVGNNDITWNYVACRDQNDDANGSGIDGNAIMLRRAADESRIYSSAIAGGIKSFKVKLYRGFTSTAVARQVEVFVNGTSVGVSEGFTDTAMHTFEVDGINVSGDFTLEIKNITTGQVIVDDIEWVSYGN